jgi:hypothetical protein
MNLIKGTQLQPNQHRNNKKKIINDPVYGFITIPDEIIFDILHTNYFEVPSQKSHLVLKFLYIQMLARGIEPIWRVINDTVITQN